ncbi:MAG: transcription antitermination factor NusB [Rhodospirillales bacterium]
MSAAGRSANHRGRRAARLAAVQAVYEMDIGGASAEAVLGEFLAKRWTDAHGGGELPAPDGDFLARLVRGVAERRSELDAAIESALTGTWTVDRLEVLLRAILRAGAYELVAVPEVPTNAAISEYVDVAHAFFPGREPGLVNAVLDRLAQTLRADGDGDAADPDGGRPPRE